MKMAESRSEAHKHVKFYAHIAYEDDYVQPLLLKALETTIPRDRYELVAKLPEAAQDKPTLQIAQYESIAFELALRRPSSVLVNSYVIRKALIRKHYLADSVSRWLVKRPTSSLRAHVKPASELEVDYAEYLDEALLEAYELRDGMAANADKKAEERIWWILKPSMADRGNGIRLFSTEEELAAIFEEWEEDEDEDEDEDDQEHDEGQENAGHGTRTTEDGSKSQAEVAKTSNNVYASQLRHFVAQEYIHPPLLLPTSNNVSGSSAPRKFHIRTYVLAIGGLKVYVYRPMLALFAAAEYVAPWVHTDLKAHLTNTCAQGTDVRDGSVRAFWDLEDENDDDGTTLPVRWKERAFEQICAVTGEVFEAAARNSMVNFQVLPNAFEVFGLDYLVDAEGVAWLLEVNAFPDFKQTGGDLQGLVQGLFEETISLAVLPFFCPDVAVQQSDRMVKVLDIDLGRK